MNKLHPASLRIIALPLARVRIPPDARLKSNTNDLLVFYHFNLILPHAERKDLSWHQKLLKNVTNKATSLWYGLAKAPKGSWKQWTYGLGERMADQIEFEELALGNVDPSLGPTIPTGTSTKQVNDVSKNLRQFHSLPKIPLIYPPSLYPISADHALRPLVHLRSLLASHGPRHRRGFILWLFVAPLTFPIALIPLIPNLPLFFCVWRSWTHYKAYRSSRYLSTLIDRGFIEPIPSPELDRLYASCTPPSQASPNPLRSTYASESSGNTPALVNVADKKSETGPGMEAPRSKRIFLTIGTVPQIVEMFGLPESTTKDMHRAMNQVCVRLEKSP